MVTWNKGWLSAALVFVLTQFGIAADRSTADAQLSPAPPIYIAVNQDIAFPTPNAIRFLLAQGNQLTFQSDVYTGGYGIQGGFFSTSRVNSVPSISAPCIYVSDSGSNDIAAISLQSQDLVGNFSGSQSDDGSSNGIGLAVNANYLYASFTSSQTIGTFALQGGCGLTFLGDVAAAGLQGGSITGMSVHGNILVVAYGDGSIQSFNVAGGLPVSNNDLQNSTAFTTPTLSGVGTNLPMGVDISRDGHYAIFGEASPFVTLETSDLSSGKLAKTVVRQYPALTGVDTGTVRLSPDQRLLYVMNSESGTVMAFFFNAATGALQKGCTSRTLRGFNGRPWYGSIATRDTTGTGNVLYVAEFARDVQEVDQGPPAAVGIVAVTATQASCTLAEVGTSPVLLNFPGALSLGVYPPRPF